MAYRQKEISKGPSFMFFKSIVVQRLCIYFPKGMKTSYINYSKEETKLNQQMVKPWYINSKKKTKLKNQKMPKKDVKSDRP